MEEVRDNYNEKGVVSDIKIEECVLSNGVLNVVLEEAPIFSNPEKDVVVADQNQQKGDVEISKELKPSDIAKDSSFQPHRDTGRITDLFDLEIPLRNKKLSNSLVCCFIDPYIVEEESIYFPGFSIREGDVYIHRAVVRNELICFNICSLSDLENRVSFQRATDGKILVHFQEDKLYDQAKYYLVKSESCSHRHHDLRRYSCHGRILKHLCTSDGLLSTVKKLFCITNCVDEVAVETIKCERSLYRKQWQQQSPLSRKL